MQGIESEKLSASGSPYLKAGQAGVGAIAGRILARPERLAASGLAILSQDYAVDTGGEGRSPIGLTVLLSRADGMAEPVLAAIQTLAIVHGDRSRELAAMAILASGPQDSATGGKHRKGNSPSCLMAAADLAWSRLAGGSGVIESRDLKSLAHLSPRYAPDCLDPDFMEAIREQALELCRIADPGYDPDGPLETGPSAAEFRATAVGPGGQGYAFPSETEPGLPGVDA